MITLIFTPIRLIFRCRLHFSLLLHFAADLTPSFLIISAYAAAAFFFFSFSSFAIRSPLLMICRCYFDAFPSPFHFFTPLLRQATRGYEYAAASFRRFFYFASSPLFHATLLIRRHTCCRRHHLTFSLRLRCYYRLERRLLLRRLISFSFLFDAASHFSFLMLRAICLRII